MGSQQQNRAWMVAGSVLLALLIIGWIGGHIAQPGSTVWMIGPVGLGFLFFRRKKALVATATEPSTSTKRTVRPVSETAAILAAGDKEDDDSLVSLMLAQRRYALLLRPQVAAQLLPGHIERAQRELDQHMAMVPAGDVLLRPWGQMDGDHENSNGDERRVVFVEPLFLDRYPVTNREFFEFVAAGGYQQAGLWDEEILPAVLEFVDISGEPGPRDWENGHYPMGTEDLPVVGVSWYEAAAYARWVGKRIPTDAEWVKAASWPVPQPESLPQQRRFPWGDVMDTNRANLWTTGAAQPVAVEEFAEGVSVGGVYQMVGNVWEWTSSNFGTFLATGRQLELPSPMKTIRGGAFDTYLDTQATNQFHSGECLLARKHNIGFRLALGACDVEPEKEGSRG